MKNEEKVMMAFVKTGRKVLSFGDLRFLLLKRRRKSRSRYPTKEKKRQYREWEKKFSSEDWWEYPFRSCEFSEPALSQLLDKMCKKGYLHKIGKGKYALSEEYIKEPIRAMDKEILSSCPLKSISIFHKIPDKDKFPSPVHIYGVSEDLIKFLNSKKTCYKKFEKMIKNFHLVCFRIMEFKKKLVLDYIKSKFFKRCKASEGKNYREALRYAKEHPQGFLSILENMVSGMEFFPNEIEYTEVILLSKMEENVANVEKYGEDAPMLDYEIDENTLHKLPEMVIIKVIEEIIRENIENLYPLIPTIVYAPVSIPKAVWKSLANDKEFME